MKILFYGDSITDMGRTRDLNQLNNASKIGYGYPMLVAGDLHRENPVDYEILNRGVSGNRIVDLYARIKSDVWNLQPDVLSILVGVNDVWHEVVWSNGVDLDRFEKVYSMIIEDTIKTLPNIKIILCEPFVLKGISTENTEEMPDKYERFNIVYKYAEVVKKLAQKYNLYFVPLQQDFNEKASKYGAETYLCDGVHPTVAGARLIADNWLKIFKDKVDF